MNVVSQLRLAGRISAVMAAVGFPTSRQADLTVLLLCERSKGSAMLAVEPHTQGQGLGRALLGAVIERACVDGYAAVVLCSASWMTPAHRLYARSGFRRTPELDLSSMPGSSCGPTDCRCEVSTRG